jgi:probable F420-dependent oxidoreductase
MGHPFRFAVQSYTADSGRDWRDKARRAEELGYSTLFVADHYLGPGSAMDSASHPPQAIASVPAMMAAAAVTTSLRVGARVIGVDYHVPVVLAKELMTIDFLSEGRLEIGLGAGWLRPEYEAMGVRFDAAPTRIARLEEVVALVKACMRDEQVSQTVDGHLVTGFEAVPKPVQRPGPPIMIGGGGRRILELAAREADIVSFNFNNGVGHAPDPAATGPAQMAEKVEWVRAAAGDRFDSLELDIGAYFVAIGAASTEPARNFMPLLGTTAEAVIAHPHALIGEVSEICDELEHRRSTYGVSYITVFDFVMDAFAPVVEHLAGR